jgi:hypothetical protein
MLVDPRIEHVDPSGADDSSFIELTDQFGERVQIYFTNMAALHDFVQDLGIVVEGVNYEPPEGHAHPVKKPVVITRTVH